MPGARWAAAWALCAALTIGCQRAPDPGAPLTALADLARDVGPTRILEGRLPGGFAYGPWPTVGAPERPRTAALAMAARLRETYTASAGRGVTGSDSARTRVHPAVAASAALILGDVDGALAILDEGRIASSDALVWTVSSVAYLEQSRRVDSAEAAARAVDAADHAVRLDPASLEARFTRAAALERLGLVSDAAAAWDDYQQRDTGTGWRAEALQRRAAQPRDTSWQAFAAAMATGGQSLSDAEVRRMATRFSDRCRQLIDDDLLRRWAQSASSANGDPATISLDAAARIADVLWEVRGDPVSRELVNAARASDRAGTRAQVARGLLAMRQARTKLTRGEIDAARPDVAVARTALASAPGALDVLTLFELLGGYYHARYAEVSPALERLAAQTKARGHLIVTARCLFLLAAIAVREARSTDAELLYAEAGTLFERLGESGYLASAAAILSNRHREQGDDPGAWSDLRRAFPFVSDDADPQHAYTVIRAAQSAAVDAELPDLGRRFASALTALAERWHNAVVLVTALADEGRQAAAEGDRSAAQESIRRAREALRAVADPNVLEVSTAVVDRAESVVVRTSDPCRAAQLQQQALATLTRVSPYQLALAYLERGRANLACRRLDEAEADFRAGIDAFERQRLGQQNADRRVSRFDEVWDLYGELVHLLAVARSRPDLALVVAERSRARTLDETVGASKGLGDGEIVASIQRALPANVTVFTYTTLPRDTLLWAITRDEVRFARLDIGAPALAALVRTWRTLVITAADERDVGRQLYARLIAPLAPSIRDDGLLLVIGDGPLHALPIAALWDGTRYLVERFQVWTAPSLAVMSWAATRAKELDSSRPPAVLAVGAPAHSSSRFSQLPRLSFAAREASEVAALYPSHTVLTGADASKPRVLDALGRAQVVHVAAHAVANLTDPTASFIVAAEQAGSSDDVITPLDLARLSRSSIALVVLSACRTAGGRVARGEGALSLARAFMSTGVPAVVSNQWDASDRDSYAFFVAFHRELAHGQTAAAALRAVQRRYVTSSRVEDRAVSVWGGVVGLGYSGPVVIF